MYLNLTHGLQFPDVAHEVAEEPSQFRATLLQLELGVGDLFRGVRVAAWGLPHSLPERFEEYIDKVSKFIEAKIIVLLVGETYDLADFQLAIKKSTEVGRGGKVFLKG